MVTLELLTNKKVNSLKPIREEGVGLLMKYLKKASHEKAVVTLCERIRSLSADMSCRMIFGNKFEDKGSVGRRFLAAFHEISEVGIPNSGDFFPCLASLDLRGLTKRTKRISKVLDVFLESVVDGHLRSRRKIDEESRDLVGVMLGYIGSVHSEDTIKRNLLKAIILDLFVAASDTTTTLIEWVMSKLIRDGTIMKKLQRGIGGSGWNVEDGGGIRDRNLGIPEHGH